MPKYYDLKQNILEFDMGVPETALIKSTLKVKGKEISKIEESRYFNTKLKISVQIW